MSPEFRRVLEEARRWGVDVLIFADVQRIGSGEKGWMCRSLFVDRIAPASLAGIRWPERSVWWADSTDAADALDLSHEVLHCVVGTDPNDTEEIEGPMLALEWEAARRLNLKGFAKYIAAFGVLSGDEWGDLSGDCKAELLAASRRAAELAGLMRDGRPTYAQQPLQGAA